MKPAVNAALVAVSLAFAAAAATIGQSAAGDTFTATVSVQKAAQHGTAAVTVRITQYATEAQRKELLTALKDGGTGGARALLAKRPDAGYIQVGDMKAPIKYAWKHQNSELITVATAAPIAHVGSGLPDAKSIAGFDVAVAVLQPNAAGTGIGELAPAAKLSLDENGAVKVEDYSQLVLWLKDVARAK